MILFGVGEVDTEGIYTVKLELGDRCASEDLNVDVVLAFESRSDATRYASQLDTLLFKYMPWVYSSSTAEIVEFCDEQGYELHIEPCGSTMSPPPANVAVTDWERYMSIRDG